MARPSNRRNETPPLTVRLSPAEREALRRKAARAGIKVSDGARAAFEAWDPAEWRRPEPAQDFDFLEGE